MSDLQRRIPVVTRRVPALAFLDEKYGLDALGPGLLHISRVIRQQGGKADPERLEALVASLGGPWEPIPRRLDHRYDRVNSPVVYYLRLDRLCKIGFTTNLPKRTKQLPHDELLATEPGGMEVERHRHAQFRSLRHRDEWFRYEADLQTHVESLRAAL